MCDNNDYNFEIKLQKYGVRPFYALTSNFGLNYDLCENDIILFISIYHSNLMVKRSYGFYT